MTAIDRIKPFAEGKDDVQVVIDTPRGSRCQNQSIRPQ